MIAWQVGAKPEVLREVVFRAIGQDSVERVERKMGSRVLLNSRERAVAASIDVW